MHLNSLILLTEATVKEIYDRYYSKFFTPFQVAVLASFDPFSVLSDSDNGLPKKIGQYGKWLLKIASNNTEKKLEKVRTDNFLIGATGRDYKSLEYLSSVFKEYDHLKKTKSFPDNLKDINKFRSIDEFLKAINEHLQKSIVKKIVKQETEYPYEDSEWKVITPLTHRSSCYWVPDRNFCTAYESDLHFKGYLNNGKLYVFKNKKNKNEIYQLFIPNKNSGRDVEFKNKKNKSFLYHSVFPEGSKIDEFIRSIGYNPPIKKYARDEEENIINETVDAINREIEDLIEEDHRDPDFNAVDEIQLPPGLADYIMLFGFEDVDDFIRDMPEDYYVEGELIPLDYIIVSYAHVGGEKLINILRLINRHNIGGYDSEENEVLQIIIDNAERISHAIPDYSIDISRQYISVDIPLSKIYGYIQIEDIMRYLRKVASDDDFEITINNETIISAIAFNGGKEDFESVAYESLSYIFGVNDLYDIIDELIIEVKKNPDLITELYDAFKNDNRKRFLSMLMQMKSQMKLNMMRNSRR